VNCTPPTYAALCQYDARGLCRDQATQQKCQSSKCIEVSNIWTLSTNLTLNTSEKGKCEESITPRPVPVGLSAFGSTLHLGLLAKVVSLNRRYRTHREGRTEACNPVQNFESLKIGGAVQEWRAGYSQISDKLHGFSTC
jgi:hypothetical protein